MNVESSDTIVLYPEVFFMPNDACPLPSEPTYNEERIIERLLKVDRIHIVGLSDDPGRTSYAIGQYLLSNGKQIVPVNPNHAKAMGLTSYPTLTASPKPVELVNVFRRSEFCADVVREAIAAGAQGVWLQSGVYSPQARQLAIEAGIDYIEDRCIMVEHMRKMRRR
jgi:predicted CoA-binding protein